MKLWRSLLGFFVDNKLVVVLMVAVIVFGGLATAPFRWDLGAMPRSPVPVDAIPDIGENQQIVFTKWPGRSPRDVEDQITYPLTTAMMGIPGVRTVRSFSMFGFSSIYVIFEEDVEFYWSRSRILEKLASLPRGTLPEGVAPALGPDATALGQIFWYTLQGQGPDGEILGGWDPDELRSIQDWDVRFALQSVPGVSEVASVGGFVREYKVDIDPNALRAHGVSIHEVAKAVQGANLDVGARTVEINGVEYLVRGIGLIEDVEDIEQAVVTTRQHTPIRVSDVAKVTLGPEQRRGALDDAGAPAVGGVVVARFGANPMRVIEELNKKIEEISSGLPRRTLPDGKVSQIKIVPFYDRSGLINETLSTLSTALSQQILITVIVILVLLRQFRSSFLVSAILPLGVLGAFIAMRVVGIDANVMALAGIAIAIGTMVDMGIVISESIVARLDEAPEDADRRQVVKNAAAEVAPAILTSTLTTIVGFLPIFGLIAAEGKLFKPLAFTKSFAMLAALLIALFILPAAAHLVMVLKRRRPGARGPAERSTWELLFQVGTIADWAFVLGGVVVAIWLSVPAGILLIVMASMRFTRFWLPPSLQKAPQLIVVGLVVVAITVVLSDYWLPLGPAAGWWANRLFVALILFGVLGSFGLFIYFYQGMLRWCLRHKTVTLVIPAVAVVFGITALVGFDRIFGWLPKSVRQTTPVVKIAHALPGFGREFMPPFDEGAFLYMPSTMPHASMGEALGQLSHLDAAIAAVPEVERAVGKLGRAESPLDPAPVSMFEIIVNYKPEYKQDAQGRRLTFRYDEERDEFARDDAGELIPDADGPPFRNWRPHIRSSNDIWNEIQSAAQMPGVTSAPELMPIAARIVMLQSGMRAPLGLKIRGPDLESVEQAGARLEAALKKVPSVRSETVLADRVVGKPYLELVIDREAISRHGISIAEVQQVIQRGLGGMALTRTVEGRERYPVRVRYMREERDSIDALEKTLVPSPLGHQIPLEQLADIRYVKGPQAIKSEDTFLTSYVVFDKVPDVSEVDVVQQAGAFLKQQEASGELVLPIGVNYKFAGSYENQVRSEKSIMLLFPLALALISLLIYFQFKRVTTTLIIFSSVLLGIAGAFVVLWLYGLPSFLDFSMFGTNMRDLFQVHTINISVAVWVGVIALSGIATDNGVILATYLKQRFEAAPPTTIAEVRERTVEAGNRRVRACMMTTATTLIALLPVVTSTGRGADVMVPMALPAIGGMIFALGALFVVPVLYALVEELKLRASQRAGGSHAAQL